MNSEQLAAIERLRELEKKATPGEWVVDEAKRTFNLTKIYAPSDFVGSNFINKDADLICALRNDGMPLIEALQQSLSEAQADARVFSGSYNALAVDFGRLREENERLKEELQDTQDDKLYVDSESQMLINENNQLKAENERLRDLLKDACTDLGRMTLLRDKFYCEMEAAQTETVFAKRERDALQARIDGALAALQRKPKLGESTWRALDQGLVYAIKILTGEGEA